MKLRFRSSLVVRGLLLSALGLGPAIAQASFDSSTLQVANGEAVPECGFTPVVATGRCTAALVHPKVVLYASHCGKARSLNFTHSERKKGRKVPAEYCKTYPGGGNDSAKDFAFCVLKEEVTDFPIVPVAFGCELDMVKKDLDIVHVGFGVDQKGKSGTKNWGANKLRRLNARDDGTGILETAPSKVNSCSGDSGGPLMVKMEDGSWRTIGIAATISGRCGSARTYNRYAYAPGAVAWVEKESGIDITPCFSADGKWEPTAECGKFYAGSEKGHGTWADGCKGTPRSGMSATCGPAHGSGDDDDKDDKKDGDNKDDDKKGDDNKDDDKKGDDNKDDDNKDKKGDNNKEGKQSDKVQISSPEDGSTFKIHEDINVTVKIDPSLKAQRVELFLNDETQGVKTSPPYTFVVEALLESREVRLHAVATDDQGQNLRSASITLRTEDERAKGETGDDDPSQDGSDNKGGCKSAASSGSGWLALPFFLLWGWRRRKAA